MEWLQQNWVWMVFVVFIGVYLFGRRGGGGGGGGCCGGGDNQRPAGGEEPGKDKPQGHQH